MNVEYAHDRRVRFGASILRDEVRRDGHRMAGGTWRRGCSVVAEVAGAPMPSVPRAQGRLDSAKPNAQPGARAVEAGAPPDLPQSSDLVARPQHSRGGIRKREVALPSLRPRPSDPSPSPPRSRWTASPNSWARS